MRADEDLAAPSPLRVAAARAGDSHARGGVLEAFRSYLLTIANAELPDELSGRCGGSDLVQETLLEAHRDFDRFRGASAGDVRAWLRGILRNNLADLSRRHRGTDRRGVHRERPLDTPIADGLVDPEPTPATSAGAREETETLDAALDRLPPDERAVILLRNRDHLAFDAIGAKIGRTGEAARKLWARAIGRLQSILENGPR